MALQEPQLGMESRHCSAGATPPPAPCTGPSLLPPFASGFLGLGGQPGILRGPWSCQPGLLWQKPGLVWLRLSSTLLPRRATPGRSARVPMVPPLPALLSVQPSESAPCPPRSLTTEALPLCS